MNREVSIEVYISAPLAPTSDRSNLFDVVRHGPPAWGKENSAIGHKRSLARCSCPQYRQEQGFDAAQKLARYFVA